MVVKKKIIKKKSVKKKFKPIVKKEKIPKTVLDFLKKFPNNPAGVKKMAVELHSFLKQAESKSEYSQAYNNYSVEKILKERRIPVLFVPGKNGLKPKWGCYTLSRTLFVLLKQMNLKPKMVRYRLNGKGPLLVQKGVVLEKTLNRMHTSIFFEFGGRIFNIDPFFVKLPLQELKKEDLDQIKQLSKNNQFFSINPGDISFENFLEDQNFHSNISRF